MPLPKLPDISNDEMRALIAKGWTPPPTLLEPYRHLLRPFYDAKGWTSSGKGKLDESDVANLVALIATFDHFGIPVPPAPVEAEREAA